MRAKFLRRMTALLLLPTLIASLAGCGANEQTVEPTSEPVTELGAAQVRYNDLRLPYSRADSLDPFLAKSSVNRQLMPLLYDSLFTMNENFEPTPLLASEYVTDGLAVRVTVNSDARFSDGSALTTSDILYSFEQAKSSFVYKARLKNFDDAIATGADTLLFTLESPDPYAAACLDFPIIKIGTSAEDRKKAAQEAAADEDAPETVKSTDQVIPTGSGRYVLEYIESEPDPVLTAFNDRFRGFYPAMTTIHLVNMTDVTALFYSLEIGNISFAFDDLSGGRYTRVNASISEYPMNNIVYVGMNQDDSALAQPVVRQALNAAINRENVLNIAFQGHATVTHSPFNPIWTPAAEWESSHGAAQTDALALLEENGFDKINTYGVRNNGRVSLVFDMVVNEGNEFKRMAAQQIAKQLRALDITVNIKTLPEEDYLNAVELGRFDLYIGEISLSPNMDLNAFFGGSGAAAHGIWNKTSADAYRSFLAGEINLDAFMEAFSQDVPFIPLCYRKGIVASVKELNGTQSATTYDLFADIEEWHF